MQGTQWLKAIIGGGFVFFFACFFNFSTTGLNAGETEISLPVTALSVPTFFSLEKYAQKAVSGGPGKDGIPAIDTPKFLSAREGQSFLKPKDVVFGAILNGEAKAYPQKILVWHEIVNDRFGPENVSVTYCPLTGTAIGFKRGETSFGVSGKLVNNNLIMYDRAAESLWPQILGTAVSGPFKGKSLQELRLVWTTWEQWRQRYPETKVLSTNTSYIRNYHRDPYGAYTPLRGYYAKKAPPLFPVLHRDRRFAPKEIVLGTRTEDGAMAFKKDSLRTRKMMEGKLEGIHYTIFYDPHLDTGYVYRNPGQRHFTYKENGRYKDAVGEWEASALPLKKVNTFDAMWFAWVAFYPETRVYD